MAMSEECDVKKIDFISAHIQRERMRSCPFLPIMKRTTPNNPYMTVNGTITEENVSDDWVASVANDRMSTNAAVIRIILTNNNVFMVLISPHRILYFGVILNRDNYHYLPSWNNKGWRGISAKHLFSRFY